MAKKKESERVILDLEDYLPYWLASLSRLAAQRLQKRLQTDAPFLTVAEWRLVAVVACNDKAQAIDISRLTRLDQVAVHRAVKSLMTKHLLCRTDCPEDKRRKLLLLTREGWSVYEQVVPIAKAIEAELLALLAPDEQDGMKMLLRSLYLRSKDESE